MIPPSYSSKPRLSPPHCFLCLSSGIYQYVKTALHLLRGSSFSYKNWYWREHRNRHRHRHRNKIYSIIKRIVNVILFDLIRIHLSRHRYVWPFARTFSLIPARISVSITPTIWPLNIPVFSTMCVWLSSGGGDPYITIIINPAFISACIFPLYWSSFRGNIPILFCWWRIFCYSIYYGATLIS